MSFSRLVIFDRSRLRSSGRVYSEEEERSILIKQNDGGSFYYNNEAPRGWTSCAGPFPTPFINLIQKKP